MRVWGMPVLGVGLLLASPPPRVLGRLTPRIEAPAEARALSRAFAEVARVVAPSVVRIDVATDQDDATASGIIIDTRGNVVTSSHVLDGARPLEIAIVLLDGRRFRGEVVGRDGPTDVAVLRIVGAPNDLSAARFADSDGSEIGEWVLAVGSPLGLEQTVTAGIISGRAHLGPANTLPADYLQTDANVNPGNSGGPLVNLEGEVIGMSALISAGPGGSYGYAIPINRVRRTAVVLIQDGRAHHPYIGVGLRDVRDLGAAERRRWRIREPSGALVSRLLRGAPAARAGLRVGDVITTIDNRDVPAPADLAAQVANQEVGAQIVIGFSRAGAARTLSLSVADRPVARAGQNGD